MKKCGWGCVLWVIAMWNLSAVPKRFHPLLAAAILADLRPEAGETLAFFSLGGGRKGVRRIMVMGRKRRCWSSVQVFEAGLAPAHNDYIPQNRLHRFLSLSCHFFIFIFLLISFLALTLFPFIPVTTRTSNRTNIITPPPVVLHPTFFFFFPSYFLLFILSLPVSRDSVCAWVLCACIRAFFCCNTKFNLGGRQNLCIFQVWNESFPHTRDVPSI